VRDGYSVLGSVVPPSGAGDRRRRLMRARHHDRLRERLPPHTAADKRGGGGATFRGLSPHRPLPPRRRPPDNRVASVATVSGPLATPTASPSTRPPDNRVASARPFRGLSHTDRLPLNAGRRTIGWRWRDRFGASRHIKPLPLNAGRWTIGWRCDRFGASRHTDPSPSPSPSPSTGAGGQWVAAARPFRAARRTDRFAYDAVPVRLPRPPHRPPPRCSKVPTSDRPIPPELPRSLAQPGPRPPLPRIICRPVAAGRAWTGRTEVSRGCSPRAGRDRVTPCRSAYPSSRPMQPTPPSDPWPPARPGPTTHISHAGPDSGCRRRGQRRSSTRLGV